MSFLKNLIKKREPRTVVIGLDGVPFTLLNKLIDKGVCPNIGKAAAAAKICQMDASLPEISSVSWASFMTGKNPARHGIFGFTDLKPGSYDIWFPNYPALREPAVWDEIGRRGARSTVLNLPGTYPARPHDGILVSGFVAIDLKKSVHPPSLFDRLAREGYRIDVDATKASDKDHFYRDLFETLAIREKVFLELWEEPCSLFIAVITDTDRLQHFEWEAVEDVTHPRHERAMEFYRRADAAAGKIIDRLEKNDRLIMMSDHGFCGIEQEVYVNRLLCEAGFLEWEEDPPGSLSRISAGARAFALDPSRIYIHRKGRYPKGKVDETEAAKLRGELKEFFLSIDHGGRKVIKEVFFREDIYEGPCMEQAPDLVLLSDHGFDLKGNIKSAERFARTHFTGMHTRDDAFLLAPAVPGGKKPHIEDLFGMILG